MLCHQCLNGWMQTAALYVAPSILWLVLSYFSSKYDSTLQWDTLQYPFQFNIIFQGSDKSNFEIACTYFVFFHFLYIKYNLTLSHCLPDTLMEFFVALINRVYPPSTPSDEGLYSHCSLKQNDILFHAKFLTN